MRKVIIIDNNRIGLFNLCSMEAKPGTEEYKLNIKKEAVLESKTLVKRIEKAIRRRRKYEGK